jgi:hypothetical protein
MEEVSNVSLKLLCLLLALVSEYYLFKHPVKVAFEVVGAVVPLLKGHP